MASIVLSMEQARNLQRSTPSWQWPGLHVDLLVEPLRFPSLAPPPEQLHAAGRMREIGVADELIAEHLNWHEDGRQLRRFYRWLAAKSVIASPLLSS